MSDLGEQQLRACRDWSKLSGELIELRPLIEKDRPALLR